MLDTASVVVMGIAVKQRSQPLICSQVQAL